jgi:GNAT superfamily N-acetyltransferase
MSCHFLICSGAKGTCPVPVQCAPSKSGDGRVVDAHSELWRITSAGRPIKARGWSRGSHSMESSLRIRQASFDNMASISELSRELAAHVGDPDPGSDASLLSDSGFGHDRWFECFVGGIVGFVLFCRRFEAHTRQKRLWLADVYVTESQRRDGIGCALIAAVQARAAELGCTAIDFELARGNHAARAFYEHLSGVVYEAIESWRLPT